VFSTNVTAAAGEMFSNAANSSVPVPPQATCTWIVAAADASNSVALRFHVRRFDFVANSDDRLNLASAAGQTLYSIRAASCIALSDCAESWQTGACENGRCVLVKSIQVSNQTQLRVELSTARNHPNTSTGLWLQWSAVDACPVDANDDCLFSGGTCDGGGLCTCAAGQACSCTCRPLSGCPQGQVLTLADGQPACVPCAAGSYERFSTLCELADSFSFVPLPGQGANGVRTCPPNTRVQHITYSAARELLELRPYDGAVSAGQCGCVAGYYESKKHRARRGANDSMICSACPNGASCTGMTFPPLSLPGYGQLSHRTSYGQITDGDFYACLGQQRCPGPSCDCIGGKHLALNKSLQARCANGYVDGSPLCALCDTPKGYALRQSECTHCHWDGVAYLSLSIGVVMLWFPVLAKLTEMMESLEIALSFIQFLGLYSTYAVEWNPWLQDFFFYCSFFNLDVSMMHMACFEAFSRWEALWLFQLFLPVIYVPLCALHLLAEWLLMRLAKRGLPPSRLLLRYGWRPRLHYGLSSLRDTYLPNAALYMHIYYITGIVQFPGVERGISPRQL
jgi:hypothetical protein